MGDWALKPRSSSLAVGTAWVGACVVEVGFRHRTDAAPAAPARIRHAYFGCGPDALTMRSAVLRSSRAGSKWRSTKSAIDKAMIQDAAKKYLDTKRYVEVMLFPEKKQ